MSTKPTTLPLWATTGTIVVPSAGTQQAGHVANTSPLAEHENWYKNLVYLWTQYLSDGDVALNSLTIATTLGVTGAATVTGVLAANGGITVITGKSVTLAGTTGMSVGSNGMSVGGNLNANGGLTVPTGQTVAVNGTSTLTTGTGLVTLGGAETVAGLITANGGISVPTGINITLAGTSVIKHGSRTIHLPASAFQARGTSTFIAITTISPVTVFSAVWKINGASNALFAPLYLPVGARIVSVITLIARDSASPGGDVSTAVYVDTVGSPGGTNTAFVGTNTSLFTGIGVVNSTSPAINYTLVANTLTGITVTSTDTAGHDHLVGVQVNYDIP